MQQPSIEELANTVKLIEEAGIVNQPTATTAATIPTTAPEPTSNPATIQTPPTTPEILNRFTTDLVGKMFPAISRKNIEKYLPTIVDAFKEMNFLDEDLILMAFATIRAETAGFEPISEYKSKFNTSPNGAPFDLYDNRSDLGNRGTPDGANFKGRGFIQLTGRANYERYSKLLNLNTQLLDNPELANDAGIAAKILILFIRDKEKAIKTAITNNDFKKARRLINGGSHGLEEFTTAFQTGKAALTA